MAFDLGTLLGGVATSVIDYQTQRFTTQPVNDSPFIPNVIENVFSETQVVDQLGNPVHYCKKKTRKRRRRLATTSDIKDLAALKAVLGGGKAFETWIATH